MTPHTHHSGLTIWRLSDVAAALGRPALMVRRVYLHDGPPGSMLGDELVTARGLLHLVATLRGEPVAVIRGALDAHVSGRTWTVRQRADHGGYELTEPALIAVGRRVAAEYRREYGVEPGTAAEQRPIGVGGGWRVSAYPAHAVDMIDRALQSVYHEVVGEQMGAR